MKVNLRSSLNELVREENLAIRWLLSFRALIFLGVLGSTIFIFTDKASHTTFLYYMICFVVFLITSIGFFFWWHSGKARILFLYIQSFYDTIFCSVLIYLSGGYGSNLILLFFPLIVLNSFLLYLRGAVLAATWATFSLWAMMFSEYYHYIQPIFSSEETGLLPMGEIFYSGYFYSLFFYLTAFCAGYISEKLKVYQEQVILSGERTKNILNTMHSGVIAIDSSGRIDFINKAGLRYLDLTYDILTGQSIFNIDIPPISNFLQEIRKHFESEQGYEDRKEILLENGEILGLTSSYDLGTTSRQSLNIIVFQNLTRIKRLEHQIIEKEKLSFLGTLSAGVAHEIRNPLAAISGSVQILKNSDIQESEREKLFSLILRETERLNIIIQDFLDLTKIPKPRFEAIDVKHELEEIIDLITQDKESIEDRQVVANLGVDNIIKADHNHFHQIVLNLIKNSIEATDRFGSIRIAVKPLEGITDIYVEDNGKGINKVEIEKVFEPFYSTKKSGVGLGLSIVKQLVTLNNGMIRINSVEGSGTSVLISFEAWE